MNIDNVVACGQCGKKNRVPTAAHGSPRCAACHQPRPWLVSAVDSDFHDVIDTSVPVLVDLWAPWCQPCRTIAPILEQAAIDLAGRLKVVKVNVDVATSVSTRYQVQGIPTMLFLRDGKEVSRQIGALPAHALREWLGRELATTT